MWRRGADLNKFSSATSRLCCSNITPPLPSLLLADLQPTITELFFFVCCFRFFSVDLIILPLLNFHREREGNGKCRVELKWKCPCRGVFFVFFFMSFGVCCRGVPITNTINTTATITAASPGQPLLLFSACNSLCFYPTFPLWSKDRKRKRRNN